MSDHYEVIQRIAERIADHDILNPHELWRCKFCNKWGQGFTTFAHHVAQEIVADLGVNRDLQWIPSRDDGTELPPAENFSQAEYVFKTVKDVNRVDREYRFVSRWFRPSRDG
jgi:hypothetical protein